MNLPFFAVKAYVPGGVQNQAEKKSKNAFRPVPVQKFTFPEMRANSLNRDMFKPFRSHNGLLLWVFGYVFEALHRF